MCPMKTERVVCIGNCVANGRKQDNGQFFQTFYYEYTGLIPNYGDGCEFVALEVSLSSSFAEEGVFTDVVFAMIDHYRPLFVVTWCCVRVPRVLLSSTCHRWSSECFHHAAGALSSSTSAFRASLVRFDGQHVRFNGLTPATGYLVADIFDSSPRALFFTSLTGLVHFRNKAMYIDKWHRAGYLFKPFNH